MAKRSITIILFSVIFFIGFLLRSPEILSKNYLFGFDQGRDYIAAYHIAAEHKLTLIGAEVGAGSAGISGFFHGPGYFYLLAIMYTLFHGDPYGGLVLMYIFGIATLLVVFFTVKKMFGAGVALIALLFVSIAPLIAPQSRFLWNHHPSSFFIVLFLYFLYRVIDQSRLYAPLTVISAGLIYHFEIAMAVPLMILVFLAVPLVFRISDKKAYVFMIIAALLVLSPMILFEARHGFTATRGIIAHVTTARSSPSGGSSAKNTDEFHLSQKKDQFISNFRDSFVFESGNIPEKWRTSTLIAVLSVAFIGIISSNRRIKQYFFALFLAIPVTLLIFLPFRGVVWPYYLLHLQLIYLYAFAFGAVYVCRNIRINPWIYIVPSLFVLFFLVSILKGTARRIDLNWRVDYPDYGGKDKILGKRAAIDYIYADTAGKPFNIFVFMPPVYTWPYDYLFMTYGKQKYGYRPGTEKRGTGYLIIEVDGSKPWSYKGWLETVVKDGDIVWEQYLPKSDQIIQKRIFD